MVTLRSACEPLGGGRCSHGLPSLRARAAAGAGRLGLGGPAHVAHVAGGGAKATRMAFDDRLGRCLCALELPVHWLLATAEIWAVFRQASHVEQPFSTRPPSTTLG